jgi:hypothetical protein
LGEKWPVNSAYDSDFHVNRRVLLHAANLRHGTDGFTSPPKEGVLWIFFARKIRRLRRSWVPEASMLTTRPPKPLSEGKRQEVNYSLLYHFLLLIKLSVTLGFIFHLPTVTSF